MQVLLRLVASIAHLVPHLLETIISEALSSTVLAVLIVVEGSLCSGAGVPARLAVAALLVAAGVALWVLVVPMVIVVVAHSVSFGLIMILSVVSIRFPCLKWLLIVVICRF